MFSRTGARFTSKLPEYHIQMTDSKSILTITTYKISNSIYQKIQKNSLSDDYGGVKPERIWCPPLSRASALAFLAKVQIFWKKSSPLFPSRDTTKLVSAFG
jgi:hypothetical protein